MIEIPEAITLANQLNQTIRNKKIIRAAANSSPHKFAFYYGEPEEYGERLSGKTIGEAKPYSGRVEIEIEDVILHFNDGANLRFYDAGAKLPAKHQLLVEFEDGASLVVTISMYAGIMCTPPGAMDDNMYYRASKESISPLSDAFNYAYFETLFDEKSLKMSAKAFLATEQRIPGLGNGVLHDILLNAKIHPKKKINTLTEAQKHAVFDSVKVTLAEMTAAGGRDTERDLFGNFGGYVTKLSKNNVAMLCRDCGGHVKKEAYLGGSIYYCDSCQEK